MTASTVELTSATEPIFLYNTKTRQIERFSPLTPKAVSMYHCGPTVYDFAHIGNLKKYIVDDTLRRLLEAHGYTAHQVINITDIGHLTSDADEGDDKMVNAIKREGLPMSMESLKTVADKYAAAFVEDIKALNIELPKEMPRASEWVPEQIALIEKLFEKGLAYDTSKTVYFDVSKFPAYGKLGSIDLSGLKEGARIGHDPEKRGPFDFALWKKNPGLGFESPWGMGFPGWHIECSAMAMGILGATIDIHTGGIDHIAVHHNNEIAQSEGATGREFARFWLHSEFITINDAKMSKSKGNFITLRTLVEEGFHPLAFRYWVLLGHYRSPLNFSLDALTAAQTALERLHRIASDLRGEGEPDAAYVRKIRAVVSNDLNTPEAIALLWDLLKDTTVSEGAMRATLRFADTLLGLGITDALAGNSSVLPRLVSIETLPTEVQAWVRERESLRTEKRFDEADSMRAKIMKAGFILEDGKDGPIIAKRT